MAEGMDEESLSDKEYYERKQTGFNFNFNENEGNSSEQLSSVRKNESYELLQCDGFSEAAQNNASLPRKKQYNPRSNSLKIHEMFHGGHPLDMCVKEDTSQQDTSASQVIRNMIFGLEYNLNSFKGKDEKFQLLKSAIETHDGNAILEVVLFIKNSLKKSIFQRELLKYPDAVNAYLSYLYQDHETDELSNMLLLLDKPEDAAMFKYGAITSVQNSEKKGKLIENCLNTHFQPGSVSSYLRESVLEHKLCLADHYLLKEHQITSDVDEVQTNKLFEELTGKKSLIGSSALCNLVFCFLNFSKVKEISFISPHSVKIRYKLSTKQFSWCALRVLSALKQWPEISELFLTKSWIGGTKIKACIAITQILEILEKEKAPDEVMQTYVSCLEKQELRLMLAKKYKCHSIVLEILKKAKDRKALMEYKSTLSPHSAEFNSASAILNQSGVKWQN